MNKLSGIIPTTSSSIFSRCTTGWPRRIARSAGAVLVSCLFVSAPVLAQLEQDSKVSAADGAPFDQFGSAVALSGLTAVVGSPRDDDAGSSSGSAYVFEFNGLTWVQVAKLTASDATATDLFGSSVGIDGDVIVVGAPFSDHITDNAGAVYLFEKPGANWVDMTETATLNPSEPLKGDGFGYSVDIDNQQVVVGAPQIITNGKGKAYVFEMPLGGWQTMVESAILAASRSRNGDRAGTAVAIRDGIIAFGIPGSDALKPDAGMVLVFERPVDGWVSAEETAAVWADDLLAGDQFGSSVATTGIAVVAGAPFHDAAAPEGGAAYLFKAHNNGWRNTTQQAKFLSSTADPIDEFGSAIAMEHDLVIVGAYKNDSAGTNAGAAFIYRRPQTGWSEAVEDDYIIASDADTADGFGTAVAVDNAMAIVGSPFDDDRGNDSGSIYTLGLTPTCLELEVFNLIAGQDATFVVRNGTPQRRFIVIYGLGGPAKTYVDVKGFCATFDFSFINYKNILGSGVFNSQGIGNLVVPIKPEMIGFTLKIQAAEKNTCPDECVSNLVKREVE